jgi:hypothetical protein
VEKRHGMKRTPLLIGLVLLLVMAGVTAEAATTTTTTATVTPSYMITYGPPTLTSLVPWTGEANSTVTITVAGSNFKSAAGIRMRRSSSGDIVGSVSSVNFSYIVASFNLNYQAPGDFQVCVYNNATSSVCGLTFTVTPPGEAVTPSSIFFDTYPTGATVLLNGNRVGTSVFTYNNATPGTYKVLIQKSGYIDYTGSVTALEGKRVKYYAQLTPLGSGITVAPATPVATATTIRKSTLKVPTTWPSTTTTEKSPVDPALVAGAVVLGLGLFAIRRR